MPKTRRKRVAVASMAVALAAAGSAAAFQQLPAGQQVNNDPKAGINPALPVNIEDPANSDVVGGSLVATKPEVPWSIFRQTESPGKDQVFSRSFAGGAWTTRGNGTVNGRSSASPTFSGSLNFDQGQDGEAPSIDFAGATRTVPWASWYEHTTSTAPNTDFNADNIFASKFDNTGDVNQGKWIFAGQGRGTGNTGTVQVPSLNIHTNRDAVNPVVQGGATVAGNDPVPWVTWQELDGGSPGPNQIFTSKGVKAASATAGATCPNDPAASANPIKPATAFGGIGGFCFQQVGIDRLDPGTGELPLTTSDPSMNVDPSRDGVEPDMAFTGPNDTVPWVVWYEQNNSGVGLRNNELVFAAKATANTTADGQFQWTAVGINGTGLLDANVTDTTPTGGKHFGACATSQTAEGNCSINANPGADAEDPRVAAGTMSAVPSTPTVPWVVWDEGSATTPNNNSVFVARLVGTQFVIANGGQPVGTGDRADITFSRHTPYVTWHHNNQVVTGHFTTPDSFVKDVPPVGTASTDAVRAPISSGCTATPFNQDGTACQASAIGTPFFLFTDGDAAHAKLFADAYQATPTTGGASNVTTSSATINGNVATNGAAVDVSFQFGTTTNYGGKTPAQRTGTDGPSAFSAALTGLPANTVIHYRVVATSDFAPPSVGQDQTLRTNAIPPTPKPGHATFGRVSVSGTTASIRSACSGNSVDFCRLQYRLTVTETLLGKKILAVGARAKRLKRHKVTVTVGTASTFLKAGQSRVVKISLNGKGKSLLSKYRTLHTTLRVTQSGKRGNVLSTTVTFKAPKPKKKHHH